MELNYKSYGTGEPLIILHGLFGMLDNWVTIAKKLSLQFEVFVLDLRNHGKSPHSDQMNYAVMARDIYNFLESQAIYHACLLGHSMGGKVALQFATLYPGFVKKLIIADIMPYAYSPERTDHIKIFEAIEAISSNEITDRRQAEKLIKDKIGDDRISMFIFKNLKKEDNGLIGWKFNAPVLKKSYPVIAGNIEFYNKVAAPVTFLKADQSEYVDLNRIKDYKSFLPNTNYKIISHASHWLHVDNTTEFLAAVSASF